MQINQSIFKAYDIRGIYPEEINEQNYEHIIRSIYTFFVKKIKKERLTIVLGRDMRVSSPSLHEVAKETLVASGATVIDIGLAPTPTFYLAALKFGYDAGIQVSASHNPPQYAGIKFVIRDGDKVIKIGKNTGMDEVKDRVSTEDYVPYTNDGKVITRNDMLDIEADLAFKEMEIDPKSIKPFKVVADPGNGMGALYIDKLFNKIPGELIRMNYELDGTFPNHQPDPLKYENLKDLCKRVKEEKADFGIAPDGDGDRVFFVNEKGDVIDATFITSLIAQEALSQHKGATVVVDIRYIRNVSEVVKKLGGRVFVSKVGHAYITEDVNREKAYFAGESSGHFYFGSLGGAESAIRVILYVLKALSEENKPLSQILAHLKSSHESGEFNFVLPAEVKASSLLEEFIDMHKDADISKLDGIAINYPQWRFSIRTSNTEPLLRLNVEGENKGLVDQKLEEISGIILAKGAKRKK